MIHFIVDKKVKNNIGSGCCYVQKYNARGCVMNRAERQIDGVKESPLLNRWYIIRLFFTEIMVTIDIKKLSKTIFLSIQISIKYHDEIFFVT